MIIYCGREIDVTYRIIHGESFGGGIPYIRIVPQLTCQNYSRPAEIMHHYLNSLWIGIMRVSMFK